MRIHAIGKGEPPPGAKFPSLCGTAVQGDNLTYLRNQVNCQDCLKLLTK